jgi:hypothetical protein
MPRKENNNFIVYRMIIIFQSNIKSQFQLILELIFCAFFFGESQSFIISSLVIRSHNAHLTRRKNPKQVFLIHASNRDSFMKKKRFNKEISFTIVKMSIFHLPVAVILDLCFMVASLIQLEKET